MDSNESQLINFDKICRLCLHQKNFLTEIFDSSINENYLSIDQKIMACASIELYKDDGLPAHICVNCLSRVNAAFDFRIQCENADKTLHDVKTILEADETCNENLHINVSKMNINKPMDRIGDVVLFKKTDIKGPMEEDSGSVLYIINEKSEETELEEKNNVLDNHLPMNDVISSQVQVKNNEKCTLTISHEVYSGKSPEPSQLSDHQVIHKSEIVTEEGQSKCHEMPREKTIKTPCPYCKKRLSRMDEHIRLLHRNRVYKCLKDGCGAEFLTLKNLQSHQLNCYKLEKGYKCTKCMKEFHRKSNFKAHVRRHGSKKDFQCQFCEKAFVDSTGLKRHFLKHHEPEQEVFVSGCCGKKFKSKEGLKKHIQKSICGIKIYQVISTEDWNVGKGSFVQVT